MRFAARDVLLRPPSDEDADDALALLRDPDVVRWNPAPLVVDRATAIEWCRRGADWSGGSHATWSAVDASTGHLLGNCSVHRVDEDHRTAKIGYRVAPWARSRGAGRLIVDAAATWSFRNLAVARIGLEHAVDNEASCRVAVAAGFVYEGTERSSYVDDVGCRHDCHLHGRIAEDPCSSTLCEVRAP